MDIHNHGSFVSETQSVCTHGVGRQSRVTICDYIKDLSCVYFINIWRTAHSTLTGKCSVSLCMSIIELYACAVEYNYNSCHSQPMFTVRAV